MSIGAGNYVARAVDAEFGVSKTGSDFVQIHFAIQEGEHAGQTITAWLYFTEKTNARSLESLRHMGCTFPDNDASNLTGYDANNVEIVVAEEEYNGVSRAKVQWVNALGGGRVKIEHPMDVGRKAAFRARMLGHVASTAGKAAAKPANGTPRAPSAAPMREMGDDDIQF